MYFYVIRCVLFFLNFKPSHCLIVTKSTIIRSRFSLIIFFMTLMKVLVTKKTEHEKLK